MLNLSQLLKTQYSPGVFQRFRINVCIYILYVGAYCVNEIKYILTRRIEARLQESKTENTSFHP